ncbi:MAG: cytochrome c biogenesis protein CcdA [Candidatus Margulisiibacteriota bacterium]
MTSNVNLAIAFFGGVLAFFSPCFLPLVPAYLIYITGLSFEEIQKVRGMTIVHSLLFILGFTIVFTSLGMAAGLAGQFFFQFADVIRIMGGLLIVFLGLYLMRIIKLPFLDLERKITISSKPAGFAGTLLVGMVFALGWTPCVGPILAGILLFASQTATLGEGALMLIAFSLGIGLPLFLFSLAVNYSLSFIKKIEKYLGAIHFVSGIFLIIVGLLLMTNYLQTISIWLIELTGYKGI